MYKRVFVFLALACALFVTPSWAQSCGEDPSCHTFSPGTTTGTYNFSLTGDGILVVQFDTVLTTFDLRVAVSRTIDAFDPNEFPPGTVCVMYSTNSSQCAQYNFTGNAGGPNGVPVKNTDYKGLITLILTYNSNITVHSPAFAHAPGDITTFTVDILATYFEPVNTDPTMGGKTPGLSSVVAADQPLVENDTFCFVTPTDGQIFSAGSVKEIEVAFQLFSGGFCPGTGTPLRDKTARFSLALNDSSGHFISFPAIVDKEEGNKFHWDHKAGLNEFDLSTVGLAPGNYTITVRSSKSAPQSIRFTLTP